MHRHLALSSRHETERPEADGLKERQRERRGRATSLAAPDASPETGCPYADDAHGRRQLATDVVGELPVADFLARLGPDVSRWVEDDAFPGGERVRHDAHAG